MCVHRIHNLLHTVCVINTVSQGVRIYFVYRKDNAYCYVTSSLCFSQVFLKDQLITKIVQMWVSLVRFLKKNGSFCF